uniref:Uncharacterized protein n=2 Tax=Arundo donax TaxID=35708 RepID=A0A0A9GIT2_ARUDO
MKQLEHQILIRHLQVMLSRVEVGLRESREIAVLRLETDELCEERQRLVGRAHGNGTGKGAYDGNEAKDEIEYRHSFTNPPAQGRLRGLAMLTGSLHFETSTALKLIKFGCSVDLKRTAHTSHIYIHT